MNEIFSGFYLKKKKLIVEMHHFNVYPHHYLQVKETARIDLVTLCVYNEFTQLEAWGDFIQKSFNRETLHVENFNFKNNHMEYL